MEPKAIYNLFKFIEDKKPQYKTPFAAKLIYAPETLTKKELNIEGVLDLSITPIQSLPDGLKVEGSLYAVGCENLKSLPNGLKVRGNLNLRNTPIQSLPNGLEVEGNLWLKNTPLSKKYTKEEIEAMVPGVKGDIYL